MLFITKDIYFLTNVRDSSTCGAVPKRSEGMSREDGEVRIARPEPGCRLAGGARGTPELKSQFLA